MWSDPIADMFTRIRNAVRNGAPEVRVPASRVKLDICRVLQREGFLGDVDRIDDGRQGFLRINLKYGPQGERTITHLRRVSRGGCRRYRGAGDLPRIRDGMGIFVVSTSRGMLSDRQCREQRVGGEVVCEVY
jgi:small subunit ribosomal protein S8